MLNVAIIAVIAINTVLRCVLGNAIFSAFVFSFIGLCSAVAPADQRLQSGPILAVHQMDTQC